MDAVREIADAVLYEGYLLWPYRRSALKNQRRWTFGGVLPAEHAARHPDDRAAIRSQCLVEDGGDAVVDARTRFLHVVRRQVVAGGEPVEEAVVAGERHMTWEEATERELGPGPIDVPAGSETEHLGEGVAVVRSWEGLKGRIDVTDEVLRPGLRRLTVVVENTTPFPEGSREDALRHALCSTHTVLRVTGGAFVSLTDPPAHLREEAESCTNDGAWPILVGEPGSTDVLLSSPIILEDHPRIAPESAGDLFDGGEIDHMLVLNILSLTDEEKAEMRASDPRAREILERTEALTDEQIARMNGAIRDFTVHGE